MNKKDKAVVQAGPDIKTPKETPNLAQAGEGVSEHVRPLAIVSRSQLPLAQLLPVRLQQVRKGLEEPGDDQLWNGHDGEAVGGTQADDQDPQEPPQDQVPGFGFGEALVA